MGCAAIQPFVYISNNKGPTANWFEGPIANLKPKPLLEELKNAYAPFGISIDLADRHFVAGDNVPVDLHLFNDTERPATGTITIGVYRQDELMHEAAGFEPVGRRHDYYPATPRGMCEDALVMRRTLVEPAGPGRGPTR